MSWADHINHPSDMISVGQIVKVSVLSLDPNAKKVSLSMKPLKKNPWEGFAKRYPPGTVLQGVVQNITSFGVFVEVEKGINGLVHISELSGVDNIRHPGELVSRHQVLPVVILEVDERRRRISLRDKHAPSIP